ncbi:subclass B1 metallo-beta-lactamase [Bacillus atrophaeus]|uniref:subclass B1 metallo-beta-lactamase n=1 Tax=Bacillus atrophaeus TaxID=1452 RepID=UPI00227E03DF|nr:subclass B1 metallo-beta-lactamase [Bacillus atrophaeus]MCY8507752.1 subclass B1 metallo-beta-lactamase [Bacillus atrophaeus]MCY8969491.1 subclass B1 metallo-beta-lactamase [Bacillus atrophaeus]
MKISKGWIGKVVFSLLLTLSVFMTSFNDQMIAQSKKASPTQITNPDKTIVLTKLDDKVWAHTSYNDWNGTTYDHNGLIVATSKGIVLIDTAWGNDQKTEELLKMIKKHFKKKVVLALITHAHDDSISGIRALLNQGIDVRSTLLTAKLAKEYGYPSPNPTLDVKPVMKVGNTVIVAFYPGEGHSSDNITVWLPQYNLLFGGCFIKSLDAKDLGNLSDANVEQWDESVKKVIEKYPDVKTVVPGHGNWGDESLLFHTIDLIKQHTHNKS